MIIATTSADDVTAIILIPSLMLLARLLVMVQTCHSLWVGGTVVYWCGQLRISHHKQTHVALF